MCKQKEKDRKQGKSVVQMKVRAPPFRSEIHKAKWGQERMGQGWLLASFRGCREIAENADADMRDREKLAFETSCGE